MIFVRLKNVMLFVTIDAARISAKNVLSNSINGVDQ